MYFELRLRGKVGDLLRGFSNSCIWYGSGAHRRLNQSYVSAELLLNLIAIYCGTAKARRLNWA